MRTILRIATVLAACTLALGTQVKPADVREGPAGKRQAKAAVIVCKGMIDDGLYRSIRRRTERALEGGADYLVYEISTYGGLLDAADDIAKYFIQDLGHRTRTVAYVTTEAISAGALISVSCQDIIMRENTTIGDCAPIAMGTKLEGVEREKAESFLRAAFQRAAEANGYPPALLKAMVTMQLEVWRIRNIKDDKYGYFEGDRVPTDANTYDLATKEQVDKASELLTLTASKAQEYGIARAVVADVEGVLEFLEKRDGVTFAEKPQVLTTNWSEEMVRVLNNPAVTGVLFLLALLGVYIELSAPGFGLPGLVAVICFAVLIGSKYLWGLANWVEVLLLIGGVALLLVEIFLLPGFGVAGIAGVLCILAGLFGMLIKNAPSEMPWPSVWRWGQFTNEVLALAGGFAGFLVLAWLVSKWMPRLRFMSGLVLTPGTARAGAPGISMTSPEGATRSVKVGDIGEVVTPLRPTGRARFNDAIVDVVATAEFIGRGAKVQIIEIHGNRVVVTAVVPEARG